VSFSFLPPRLAGALLRLVATLDPRDAWRVPVLLVGILFASGRGTVTSWFRACGITDDFRPAYSAVDSVGRRADACAVSVLDALEGIRRGRRTGRGDRRHAAGAIRPVRRGGRRPPQPQPQPRRRTLRLRPRLGRLGPARLPPAVRSRGPAAAVLGHGPRPSLPCNGSACSCQGSPIGFGPTTGYAPFDGEGKPDSFSPTQALRVQHEGTAVHRSRFPRHAATAVGEPAHAESP
jgi:hypothetical protein